MRHCIKYFAGLFVIKKISVILSFANVAINSSYLFYATELLICSCLSIIKCLNYSAFPLCS